jgi:hypothetical protein
VSDIPPDSGGKNGWLFQVDQSFPRLANSSESLRRFLDLSPAEYHHAVARGSIIDNSYLHCFAPVIITEADLQNPDIPAPIGQ